MFQHVVLSCLIQSIIQNEYYFDHYFPHWVSVGTWYNPTICPNLLGSVIENIFVTAREDIYDIICAVNTYET